MSLAWSGGRAIGLGLFPWSLYPADGKVILTRNTHSLLSVRWENLVGERG